MLWTAEEDEKIMRAQKAMGNKWVRIALLLPGRTDNDVKHRWNRITRNGELSTPADPAALHTPKETIFKTKRRTASWTPSEGERKFNNFVDGLKKRGIPSSERLRICARVGSWCRLGR